LSASDESFDSLLKKTGMTAPALNRHLKKLHDRRIIQKTGKIYQIRQPNSGLSRCLLEIAIQ
jgi:predicted transcriptional regulator